LKAIEIELKKNEETNADRIADLRRSEVPSGKKL